MIFRFEFEAERDKVLEMGPYETLGAPWTLKKMPYFFNFDESAMTTIPIWVCLSELPIHCWSESGLSKIASQIEEPITADECTVSMNRTGFARLLVEIDIMQGLKKSIPITLPNGKVIHQKVVYEREPKFCTHCRFMGHEENNCRRRNADESQQRNAGAGQIVKKIRGSKARSRSRNARSRVRDASNNNRGSADVVVHALDATVVPATVKGKEKDEMQDGDFNLGSTEGGQDKDGILVHNQGPASVGCEKLGQLPSCSVQVEELQTNGKPNLGIVLETNVSLSEAEPSGNHDDTLVIALPLDVQLDKPSLSPSSSSEVVIWSDGDKGKGKTKQKGKGKMKMKNKKRIVRAQATSLPQHKS